MEAQLIIHGMGPWKNFDEIEEFLILDELILLNDVYVRDRHNYFRMHGSLQGIDLGEYDGGDSGEELPPEILAAEREWQEKKRKAMETGEGVSLAKGIGYKRE